MKSRIRSRWHRPNEKTLGENGSPKTSESIGEIDVSSTPLLTDDLSNFKPTEKSNYRQGGNDKKEHSQKESSEARNRRPRRRKKSNERLHRSDSSDENNHVENSSNQKNKRPRRRKKNRKNTNSNNPNYSKADGEATHQSSDRKASKASGLKGFLGKLFG